LHKHFYIWEYWFVFKSEALHPSLSCFEKFTFLHELKLYLEYCMTVNTEYRILGVVLYERILFSRETFNVTDLLAPPC